MSVGLIAALTPSASAAPAPVSQSTGRFLSGVIGDTNLDNLAAVKGEAASNTGGPTATHQHLLAASLLNYQLLHLPSGIQLPGGGVLTLGAANQFAQASGDGSAHGASGAVTNSGAVAFGGAAGSPQSDATLDLTGSKNPLATVGSLKLTAGALSATADQGAGGDGPQFGHYEIANLKLDVSSPALASAIKQLTGGTGQVPGLSDLIATLGGSGLPIGPLANVSTPDSTSALTTALKSLGDVNIGDGAITGSLTNGTLTIDVAKLLKTVLNLDLNDLPPNTHLLEYVAQALPKALSNGLAELQKQLSTVFAKLSLSLDGTPLAPTAKQVTSALAALLKPLTAALDDGASNLSSTAFVPLAKQLEKLVDPVVNVQERSGGTFTERALQLNVIGDPLAVVNLASASVGPNAGPGGGSSTPPGGGSSTPPGGNGGSTGGNGSGANGNGGNNGGATGAGTGQHLANTGAETWLTKVGLFGLLGLCMGGALFGATLGIRRVGRHTV